MIDIIPANTDHVCHLSSLSLSLPPPPLSLSLPLTFTLLLMKRLYVLSSTTCTPTKSYFLFSQVRYSHYSAAAGRSERRTKRPSRPCSRGTVRGYGRYRRSTGLSSILSRHISVSSLVRDSEIGHDEGVNDSARLLRHRHRTQTHLHHTVYHITQLP